MIENEIPKHRKKKQSSISKSSTKSKHKHEYKEVLLIHNDRPHWATVCKICGKIGDLHFFETEPYRDGLYRQLDSDEVFASLPRPSAISEKSAVICPRSTTIIILK